MELNVSMTEALTVARTSISESVLMDVTAVPVRKLPGLGLRSDSLRTRIRHGASARIDSHRSVPTGIYYILW
jgi:hypothetical protein